MRLVDSLVGRRAYEAGHASACVGRLAAPCAHVTRTALVSPRGCSATAEGQWVSAGAGVTAGRRWARWRCGGMCTAPRHQGSPAACAQHSSSTGWVVDRAKLSSRCRQQHAARGRAHRSGGCAAASGQSRRCATAYAQQQQAAAAAGATRRERAWPCCAGLACEPIGSGDFLRKRAGPPV